MKNFIFFCVVFFNTAQCYSQSVGIGTNTPNSSAILDLSATNKGVLFPRLTQTQRDQIVNPVNGLVIFNTTTNTIQTRDTITGTWTNVSPDAETSLPTGKLTVVYSTTTAYGFFQNSSGSGFWISQPLDGTVIGASSSLNMVMIYTSTTAYGFTQSGTASGTWTTQSISGTPLGIVSSGKSIVVYTNSNAYGLSIKSALTAGVWDAQSLDGSPTGYCVNGQSIMLYTNTNSYILYQNSIETAIWKVQALTGTPIRALSSK